jgi:TatD DNase family protein
VHSFTGTETELKEYLDLGLYIGVNGCSLKTDENLENVKKIPLDRIMLESNYFWVIKI